MNVIIPSIWQSANRPPRNADLVWATDGHTVAMARYISGDEEFVDVQDRPWDVEAWAHAPNPDHILDELARVRAAMHIGLEIPSVLTTTMEEQERV